MKLPKTFPAILLASISTALTAPVFQADPNSEGVTTDIWDVSLGAQVIFSSQQHGCCGNSDPRSAFGFTTTSGWVEPTHAIWQDSAPGVTDFLEWQTAQPIDLSAISLHLQDDGSTFRSALDFRLFASQDGVNFSLVSSGVMPANVNGYVNNPLLIADSALSGTTSAVRAFRLEMTRATAGGTRVMELDATGTAASPVTPFLDRVAFNDSTNSLTGRGGAGKDDEGAGLGFGYTFSSAVVGGTDTVRDAFGGNHGTIEPEDFIFGDGGAVDNGNLTMGDGETVDFIEWHTAQPISLAGFRIGVAGDGASPNRDTELVRFLVGGVAVDLFDNNGFDGEVTRLFAGGAALADTFRVEFTRTTGSGGRVFEIDAITAVSTGWLGTSGNSNWSSPGNWDGTGPAAGERNLFFGRTYKAVGGTGSITAQNNLVGYVGNRIAFQDSDVTGATVDGVDAGDTAFTVTGNGFTLSEIGGKFPRIENGSFVTQTFNLTAGQTITLNDATNHKAEINPTNGDLIFSATTPIDLAGTTQLQISGNSGHTVTFNGVISSSGNGGANGLAIVQNSHVVFAASNTYTGATNVNAGVLTLGHVSDSIADTAEVRVNGGTLDVPNTDTVGLVTLSSGTISGAGTLTGSAYALTNTGTISANLGATAATLTKTGAGTATITGNAPYTGLTRILGGTLKFEMPVFYNGFASDIVNESVVAFNLSGFFNQNIAGTGTITRGVGEFILGGGTTASSQSWVLTGGRTFYNTQVNLGGGAISVSNGAKLIKNTGGDLTLTNAVMLNDGGGLNNRFNGTETIGNVTLPASGFVVFNLDDQPTSTLNLNGPAVVLSGAGLTVAVGGANATVGFVTLSHAIDGTALTKTGPGRLTLDGVQTYATLTTQEGRTDLASALGTGASTVNANAETNFGVSQTLAALNIGDGATVTLSFPLPTAPALANDFGGDLTGGSAQAVPEPGSLALLLLGGALLLRRAAARKTHAIRLLAVSFAALSAASAAPVFQADPNAEGVTTDAWDLALGAQVVFSSPQLGCCGDSDPRAAFGFTSGFVEATHAIWQDGAAGVIDFLEWQTPQPLDLSAISLHLFDDGSVNRSALDFKLFASQDGVNYSQISGGTMPAGALGYFDNPLLITDGALTGTTSAVRAFRLEMTRTTGAGTRVAELDATGTAAAPVTTFLDRLAFNDATNSLTGRGGAANDDEGAGLGSGYTFSSAVAGGADTVRDAFGGNHGTIEPEDFIFGDGGVADNGNLTLGDGGETVDFIQWQTSAPLTLAGFRIGLSGDGASPDRDTQLIRFLVEGLEVALFDNDGFDGNVTHLFAGGAVTGDDFRIEFTRTNGQGGRIFEIDAITTAVPEPGSMTLVLLGGALLARRRGR